MTCRCIFGSASRAEARRRGRRAARAGYTNPSDFCQLSPARFAVVSSRRRPTTKLFHLSSVMRDSESVSEKAAKPALRVRVAVVLASVVVALLIFEVFLRTVGYTYPVFYQPDEVRGYSLKPNMEGWYRKEGAAFVRINGDGLRDREHSKQKAPGTLRIAVVGDSYAEAFQVEQDKAFWSVMERRLGECPALAGRRVEVINFGVSGYGTAQELLTLREKVWDYSPDVVLLALTTNNDVLDNSRALKQTDEIPYFVLRGDQLVLDNSFRDTASFRLRDSALNRAGRWLRDHLRFVQAIHEAHAALKSKLAEWRERRAARQAKQNGGTPGGSGANAADSANAAGGAQGAPQEGVPTDELGAANMIYREPQDDVWRDAWRVTEKLLATMSDEVKSHGAKFFVVTLSNGIQVYPEAAAREAFARRVGAQDLFYAERRFKSLGEREGFTVFNLAPDLQSYADEHRVFLHGFGRELGNGHWNEEGHRVAGEMLAQWLCQQIADFGMRNAD
ncbi:MAG: G-D-S-L family lipolytic protein [Acidobacteria bacterium]|nr:MAG: G-D-S-L family lipolytic protein [Acidobacteriota bacterium]